MSLKLTTRQVGDVTVIDAAGQIKLGEGSSVFRDAIKDLTANGNRKLLVNLGDVTYIDSSGIGEMVSGFTSVTNQGGQLKLLNLPVTLKEAKPGELPALADCDLLYAELSIHEPTVDAWRVLGPVGLAGSCSPAMLHALRQVEAAPSRQEAAEPLQAVHRLAAIELPVIPLWQLTEHFAVHASVQGVAERPDSLYEGVENWQAELRVPSE